MAISGMTVHWDDPRQIDELIENARSEQKDYLIVQTLRPGTTLIEALPSTSATDLIVFRDRAGTQLWSRLNKALPGPTYFLAVLPADHLGIAISVKTLAINAGRLREAQSLSELIARLSATGTTSFVDNFPTQAETSFPFPPLTCAAGPTCDVWVGQQIAQVTSNGHQSATDLTAMKAGLYLLHDEFDASHSCSQSIEGLGSLHSGDFWHAILHRREPDYGNAKYWFRHVGRHPVFDQLAPLVKQRLDEIVGPLSATLQRWKSRLITSSGWDPFAFVDLCEAAAHDTSLAPWCEKIQYEEMLLLLSMS